MNKIGVVSDILVHDFPKYFNNTKILESIERIYNDFIEKNNFKKSEITLVSNGYPWINHLPVTLFLKNEENESYAGIELCIPTEINFKERHFLNTHEGRTLNELHKKYKECTTIDSLDDLSRIVQAKKPNKKSIIKRGYKQANTMMVRNCNYVLVFGLTEKPESELWEKILCQKEYFCIYNL